MKLRLFKANEVLFLKPSRQEAYGETSNQVYFIRLEYRDSYKTPFIIGKNDKGEVGTYKLSDFK